MNAKYPEGDKIRLILDNHSVHTSQETQRYLNDHLDSIDLTTEEIDQIVYEVVNAKTASEELSYKRAPKPIKRSSKKSAKYSLFFRHTALLLYPSAILHKHQLSLAGQMEL